MICNNFSDHFLKTCFDFVGWADLPQSSFAVMLREASRLEAARLRLDDPPLGDPTPPGAEVFLLACALGAATEAPALSAHLFARLGRSRGAWEHLLRHALVKPYLSTELPEDLADAAREASPWTALFERPAPHRERAAWAASAVLRSRPDGRRLLCATLAEPAEDAVLRARTGLLDRLRLEEIPFVLDVYETAFLHHGERHLQDAAQAARILGDASQADDAALGDALARADWWGPLWALDRSYGELLRERRYLGYEAREGMRLHALARRLRAFSG